MAKLTELAVRSARPGRHGDGDGLMLIVSKSGARKWVLRYQAGGKRRDKGLGSYPGVGLKEARAKATEDRKLLSTGIDPIAAKRAAEQAGRAIPTFADVAAVVIADAQAKSTNAKVRYQWSRHLGETYSGPLLKRPVNEITAVEVAAVLRPVWRQKPEVARKLFPAIRSVFERARVLLRDEHNIEMVRIRPIGLT